MKRFVVVAVLAFSFAFAGAGHVEAQSLSSARIQALLDQISVLQSRLLALQAAQTGGSSTPVSGVYTRFTKDLREGMEADSQVRLLQEILRTDSDIYADGRVTGNFGPLTRAAVENFQEAYGISGEAGFVGSGTRAYLNAILAEERVSGAVPSGLLDRSGLQDRVRARFHPDPVDDDEDEDEDDDRRDGDVESFNVEINGRRAFVEVEFEDGDSDEFYLNLFDEGDIIEELADEYDMDEDDVEDIIDFEDRSEIDEIEVVIFEEDDEAEVTVIYEDEDTDELEFTVDETDEDDIIEEIADELNLDEDEVEDLVDFEYEDDDRDNDDIDEINVEVEDGRAYVTVEYEDGDEEEFDFRINEDDDDDEIEEDIIEEVAEELDMDEDDVEDIIDIDFD